MRIQAYFDEPTWTLSYLVHDGDAGVVIDPVRHFDPASGRTSWAPAERLAATIDALGLDVPYVIDTHTHADHMTGLPFFRERYGARTVASSRIGDEQKRSNIQINGSTAREDFAAFRRAKDASLPAPRLILPSLQVNVRAGELPEPESNGESYLKIPINLLGRSAL
jgi:glyoxylase-like metal-dependent hydrolase (beta-lactamase superfamily II)